MDFAPIVDNLGGSPWSDDEWPTGASDAELTLTLPPLLPAHGAETQHETLLRTVAAHDDRACAPPYGELVWT